MRILLSLVFLIATNVFASETEGTLLVEVQNYESDVKLKKGIRKQLDRGGLEWAIKGDELVIPFIGTKFVDADPLYTTRWSETDEVSLSPGEYAITFIGYEQKKLFGGIDKVLSKGAYFNERVLTFMIEPGEVTTLQILPRYQKTGSMLKVFLPALHVKVIRDEAVVQESVITGRTEQSISWDDYTGDLKVPKPD